MRAPKLVQIMRDNSDAMSGELVTKIRASLECSDLLAHVAETEQKQYAREIYQDLTEWLVDRRDSVLEQRYVALGRRRADQGVPASHLFCAVTIAREHLWEYMQEECLHEDPVEFLGGVILLRSLSCFFDHVVYFALIGYEQAGENESAAWALPRRRRSA
jgi:hypothetical protein